MLLYIFPNNKILKLKKGFIKVGVKVLKFSIFSAFEYMQGPAVNTDKFRNGVTQ